MKPWLKVAIAGSKTPAAANRVPAKITGGTVRTPADMPIQVDPQMRHRIRKPMRFRCEVIWIL